jgi:hypothetical protein
MGPIHLFRNTAVKGEMPGRAHFTGLGCNEKNGFAETGSLTFSRVPSCAQKTLALPTRSCVFGPGVLALLQMVLT